jgi:hypothetical protein
MPGKCSTTEPHPQLNCPFVANKLFCEEVAQCRAAGGDGAQLLLLLCYSSRLMYIELYTMHT